MSNSNHQCHKENIPNLRELISHILEQHDGSCLDNIDEREALSEALEAEFSQYMS